MPAPTDFRRCTILTGPTGSGKSTLALDLAEQIDGEIVAMDSMTLYRGMDIGTAKPTPAERVRVPHHIIDVFDPWETANVAWWLDRAADAVRDIESRGKTALIVGGTPLYLKAMLRGLFDGPPRDAALRARLEAEDPAALHARLASIDSATASRLHVHDVRRVVRALEVWELTGRPISEWQMEWRQESEISISRPRVFCIDRPRDELYFRIDRRVLAMLDAGWLDEARRLRELPHPLSREAGAALGYGDLFRYLDGESDWPTIVRSIQQRSRNYAKRQLTWFRHLPEVEFVPAELTSELRQSTMI